MKLLDTVRADAAALEATRSKLLDELEQLAQVAIRASRQVSDAETARISAIRSEIGALDVDREAFRARIAELELIESRTAAAGRHPVLNLPPMTDTNDVLNDRSASVRQVGDQLVRSLEQHDVPADSLAGMHKLMRRISTGSQENLLRNGEWARGLLVRSTDTYLRAWQKYATGNVMGLTEEERAALTVGSNTNGGYLVPTQLDPTVILTNAGTSNAIRGIARVVELTYENTWHGVTSAGVTVGWSSELTEVSDNSPTFGRVSIPVISARGFVQASIESFDDIAGLTEDVAMLLADAKDRLEGAAHATGVGTTAPRGIFTALNANTNTQITSAGAAAIALADIHKVYGSVPVRFRSKGKWLLNPTYNLAIKALGTALSASYTTNLTQAASDVLLGHQVIESDDAPNTQTTTALDNEVIYGDFSNYVIVDKPGSTAIEYIPVLLNTANNLPDGRRGWFMHWRTGADSVNDLAFRMLVDKTSA